MSRSRHFVTLAVILLGVVAAFFIASGSNNPSTALADELLQSTRASTTTANNNAAESVGQITAIKCQPVEVYVSTQQVRVKCSAAVQGIVYFGFAAKDPPNARNMLDIMRDALSQKKSLTIGFFMSNTSGEEFGCKKENCRTIDAAALTQ